MAKGIHMANTNGILRLGQMLALGGATMVWNAILNHVNEGEHGGYIGGGLRFPKRMEEVLRDQNHIFNGECGEKAHNYFTRVMT
jgi:hypothetical protein